MAIIDENYIEKINLENQKLNLKINELEQSLTKHQKEMNARYDGLKEQFLKLDDLQQKCLKFIETMIQASDFTKSQIWAEDTVKPSLIVTPDQLKEYEQKN